MVTITLVASVENEGSPDSFAEATRRSAETIKNKATTNFISTLLVATVPKLTRC